MPETDRLIHRALSIADTGYITRKLLHLLESKFDFISQEIMINHHQMATKKNQSSDCVVHTSFEFDSITCVAYRLIAKSEWRSLLRTIKKYDVNMDFYTCASPIEIYGENWTSKDIIKNVRVIVDPDKVAAFKQFHGDSFYTEFDFFGELIEKCKDKTKIVVKKDVVDKEKVGDGNESEDD